MTVRRPIKNKNNHAASAWSRLRDLRDNEDGAVLIYVTMISVVLLGMGGSKSVGNLLPQPQDVGQGLSLGGVRPHARPPQGRTERRVVNGDDASQPDAGIGEECDRLVTLGGHGTKQGHTDLHIHHTVQPSRIPLSLQGRGLG